MTSLITKKILVTGSSGYVGNTIIKTIAKRHPKATIIGMSRSGLPRPNSKTELLENVEFRKGDCLDPNSFADVIKEVDGVVHTVGALIEDKNNPNLTYKAMNYQAAVNMAQALNESAEENAKKTMVLISSARGPPFMPGYLEYKHKADQYLLDNCQNLEKTVLRPGFIHSAEERWWSVPLRFGVDVAYCFDKLIPKALHKYSLIPEKSIALDTVAHFSMVAAMGQLNHEELGEVIGNDLMLDYERGDLINLLNPM